MSNEWSYFVGQCTYYVAKALDWVPAGLGNANQWLDNAQTKGFHTSGTPAPGDVVVYNGPGYSQYGHVGVVEKVFSDNTFAVNEMNYTGVGQTDTRRSSMQGVAGFIEPPSGRGSIPASFNTTIGMGAGDGTAGSGGSSNPLDIAKSIGDLPKGFGDVVKGAEDAMLTFGIGVGLFLVAILLLGIGLFAITNSGDSEGGTKIVPIPV